MVQVVACSLLTREVGIYPIQKIIDGRAIEEEIGLFPERVYGWIKTRMGKDTEDEEI